MPWYQNLYMLKLIVARIDIPKTNDTNTIVEKREEEED